MSNYRKTIRYPSIAKLFVEAWFTSDSRECLYKNLDANPEWVAFRIQREREVLGYYNTSEAAKHFHAYIRSKTVGMPLFTSLRATPDTMTGQDMDALIALWSGKGSIEGTENVTSLRSQIAN
jgi:hypothetical protein